MRHVLERLTMACVLMALAVAGAAATAQAHPGHKHPGSFGMAFGKPDPRGFAGLVRNSAGKCGPLYEVKSKDKAGKERTSCTHGPDAPPPGAFAADDLRSVAELKATSARAPEEARSVTCDGANSTGMRAVAIYAYPAGQPNRSAAVIPLIREWAAQVDDVYYESARETGGSRSVRWLTEPSPGGACRIKVETLALTATGDDSFGNTLTEVHNAGYTSFDRRYVLWVDGTNGSGICGIGEYWNDDQPGQGNDNNGGVNTGYFGLTSRIDQNCWGLQNQLVEAHELGHNLGAVQASAPNDSGGAHCVDEWDIMCYSDSPNLPAMTYVCGTQNGDSSHDNRLDCNHDDYYHTNPPVGNYLATYWNTANNNFLREAGVVHDATTVTSTGDGDSFVEPGESFSFNERIHNRASTTATGVAGTVTSPSALVTPGSGSKAYPNVAADATATNTTPYTATLDAAAPCGTPVPLTVTITSSVGTHQVAAPVPTGSGGAVTSGTASPSAAIPDGNPAGMSSTTTLAGAGLVFDVNVTLNITHTWVADVRATLTGPDGTSVLLFGGVGSSGDNFTNTTLDDEAATAIAAGTAPFTGSFRPAQPLSALDGQPLAGTWTLTVVDTVPQDGGTLNSWTVASQKAACSVGPSPSGGKRADFDGDGVSDVVVGVPEEDVAAVSDAGVVQVLYGAAGGVGSAGNQIWNQESVGIAESAEVGDGFGSKVVTGDFNGDGFADLAVGVPGEDLGAVSDVGVVQVLFGSAAGLVAAGDQLWSQDTAGILDSGEAGDRFGAALAAGDFGGGSQSDLAVGVPTEDVGPVADAGVVHVLYGAAAGVVSAGNVSWSQNTVGIADSVEAGDRFGAALAAGDFGSGSQSDLAVGVPDEDVGAVGDGGVVQVLYGAAGGLVTTAGQLWSQNTVGILESVEAGDRFGSVLAAGDLGSGAQSDLLVGVPEEDVGAVADGGVVQVLYGAGGGVVTAGNQLWSQDTVGILDSVEAGDRFGSALTASELGNGTQSDLVVGVPNEDVGPVADGGVVHVLYGAGGGVVTAGNLSWSQNTVGIADSVEANDRFGAALGTGDFGNSSQSDLAIGVPDEDVGAVGDAGVVQTLYGAPGGLATTASQLWSQNTVGILDSVEAGDGFAAALDN